MIEQILGVLISNYGAFTLDVIVSVKLKSKWHPWWHPMLVKWVIA
jgi:hypothetical protein